MIPKVLRRNTEGVKYLKEIWGSILSVLVKIQYGGGARKFLDGVYTKCED